MLPLGFRFDVDAVVADGVAHRVGCDRVPVRALCDPVSIRAAGVYWAERCPRECPTCRPPFATMLTYELEPTVDAPVT